jgi:hypothetical protein
MTEHPNTVRIQTLLAARAFAASMGADTGDIDAELDDLGYEPPRPPRSVAERRPAERGEAR